MSEVVSVAEVSNNVVNVTEIRSAKGDLIVKVVREYGSAANPAEVMAFEQKLLEISAPLVLAD